MEGGRRPPRREGKAGTEPCPDIQPKGCLCPGPTAGFGSEGCIWAPCRLVTTHSAARAGVAPNSLELPRVRRPTRRRDRTHRAGRGRTAATPAPARRGPGPGRRGPAGAHGTGATGHACPVCHTCHTCHGLSRGSRLTPCATLAPRVTAHRVCHPAPAGTRTPRAAPPPALTPTRCGDQNPHHTNTHPTARAGDPPCAHSLTPWDPPTPKGPGSPPPRQAQDPPPHTH